MGDIVTPIVENQMRNNMEITWKLILRRGLYRVGYVLGIPRVRIVAFWGLYWGPVNDGNYHSKPGGS